MIQWLVIVNFSDFVARLQATKDENQYSIQISATLNEEMQRAYPVVAKSLGTENFLGLVARFRKQVKPYSKSHRLALFGKDFTAFLREMGPQLPQSELFGLLAEVDWLLYQGTVGDSIRTYEGSLSFWQAMRDESLETPSVFVDAAEQIYLRADRASLYLQAVSLQTDP